MCVILKTRQLKFLNVKCEFQILTAASVNVAVFWVIIALVMESASIFERR